MSKIARMSVVLGAALALAPTMALAAEVARRLGGDDTSLSLSARERRLISEAANHLTNAAGHALRAGVDEVVAEELRLAGDVLGEVVGGIDVEEVYDQLFQTFCLGK